MSDLNGFQPATCVAIVRFVQGYRYLDRCGEILVRLEDELGKGWVSNEISPTRGTLRHFDLGMELTFGSEQIALKQDELFVEEQFFSVIGTAYEIVCAKLEIETVLNPAFRTIFKKRQHSLSEADIFLRKLSIVLPSEKLIRALGGDPTVLHVTTTRENSENWSGSPVNRRIRIKAEGSGQITQPPFDERLIRRARTLPGKQNEALKQLLKVRSQFVATDSFATTIDVEFSYEDEFSYRSFEFREFLRHSGREIHQIAAELVR